jgi:hypothetical protein
MKENSTMTKSFKKRTHKLKGWGLLHQSDPFMQHWNILMLLCLGYASIATPFQICFMEGRTQGFFWMIMDRTVDVAFILDILVNFNLKITDPATHKVPSNFFAHKKLIGFHRL